MNIQEIEQKLSKLLAQELGHDTVMPNQTLEDLGADSLDHIDLILAIEDDFGIEIEDEEYDQRVNQQTKVAEIAQFIGEKLEV